MKTFFTYFLILFSIATYSQTNLVPNGSFEDIDSFFGVPAPTSRGLFVGGSDSLLVLVLPFGELEGKKQCAASVMGTKSMIHFTEKDYRRVGNGAK